jgi:hypothetical protein
MGDEGCAGFGGFRRVSAGFAGFRRTPALGKYTPTTSKFIPGPPNRGAVCACYGSLTIPLTFPAAVPEIPAANVDKAAAYYVDTLGFTFD